MEFILNFENTIFLKLFCQTYVMYLCIIVCILMFGIWMAVELV